MIIHEINDIQELFPYLESIKDKYYFRGYSNYEKHMCPKLGRGNYSLIQDEIKIIQDFVNIPALKRLPVMVGNLHELLELGQHYCLPTRLLDWTTNPFVALYFALGEKNSFNNNGIMIALISKDNKDISDSWSEIDGIVSDISDSRSEIDGIVSDNPTTLNDFVSTILSKSDPHSLSDLDTFNLLKSNVTHPLFANKYGEFIQKMNDKNLIKYQVNRFNERMTKQAGLFTIHKNVSHAIPEMLLDKIININLNKKEKHEASKVLNCIYKKNVIPDPKIGEALYCVEKWCKIIRKKYNVK